MRSLLALTSVPTSVKHIPLLALVVSAALPLHAQANGTNRAFPPDSVILAMVKQRVDEGRSAGIVVGIIDVNSGRRSIVAYGDPGPGQPPLDGRSEFEIGSITKVFTATMLAQMVAEGKVSLDDPVQKFLPASVHVPERNGKAITLGSLSSQNSGLPRLPNNLRPKDITNPYADYSVQQLYDFLGGYTLTRDPGEKFEYSNLGVGLLGHALSLAAGTSYEQLVHDRILAPLGMTHTAITLTPWMQEHLAKGHDAQHKVVPLWDLPTLAGAGALRSNAEDMLAFVTANIRPAKGSLGKAVMMARQPRAPVAPPAVEIGLNWMIQHVGGDVIVWHNGGTGGYRTFVGYDPAAALGAVVLTNSGNAGADDIGMHLINPSVPLTPKPVPPAERKIVPVADSLLTHYVGVYQLAPDFSIEIFHEGSALTARATGQSAFRLWPQSETEWFVKEVDAQLTFVRDSTGAFSGIVLHQGGANTPGKRVR